ncbi:MAG: HAD family hydrolase [Candidatus Sericytochromatia bacterium]|nr:HAD family hydrolase [Candidatus Sericytochromatia bacterium]
MAGLPAVFLDRDGTINVEAGYIRDLDRLVLMPGAAEAIRRLSEAGFKVILATNQSGPARGYYPEAWVQALHDRLSALLAADGARLDDVYYCPHLPEGSVPAYAVACGCRKPEPGMLVAAAERHALDLTRSFMVGDKATDVEVGHRAGCRSVLLRSGFGTDVLAGRYQWPCAPDFVADTIVEAAAWILREAASSSRG